MPEVKMPQQRLKITLLKMNNGIPGQLRDCGSGDYSPLMEIYV